MKTNEELGIKPDSQTNPYPSVEITDISKESTLLVRPTGRPARQDDHADQGKGGPEPRVSEKQEDAPVQNEQSSVPKYDNADNINEHVTSVPSDDVQIDTSANDSTDVTHQGEFSNTVEPLDNLVQQDFGKGEKGTENSKKKDAGIVNDEQKVYNTGSANEQKVKNVSVIQITAPSQGEKITKL